MKMHLCIYLVTLYLLCMYTCICMNVLSMGVLPEIKAYLLLTYLLTSRKLGRNKKITHRFENVLNINVCTSIMMLYNQSRVLTS